MKSRFWNLFLLGGLLLVGLVGAAGPTAVVAAQTNLLQNPSFEEPYSNGLAQNWSPWHEDKNHNPKPEGCSAPYSVLPKWGPEFNSALILDGQRSQHVGNQFDTWHGGVMQTISVTPGTTYRFSFSARGRASNEQYPAPSDSVVNLGVRAGIDPEGRGLWYQGVVWGGAISPHDNWQTAVVNVTAVSDKITVYAQADLSGANFCRAHLDVWFDKAELVAAAPPATNTPLPPPPPPPQPVATNTPLPPPSTNTPEVPPTETPIPTATATATAEPPQGGTICVNAFSDVNANGVQDSTEGYMAGVTFTLARDNQIVGQAIAGGTDKAICFEALPPGSYQIAQVIPAALELTTAANATIDIQAGQAVELKFGSRIRSQPEVSADPPLSGEVQPTLVVPTAVAVTTDSAAPRLSLGAISGLLAILFAIVLLGALIFVLLRQPARG
jgi:hypothetical protein